MSLKSGDNKKRTRKKNQRHVTPQKRRTTPRAKKAVRVKRRKIKPTASHRGLTLAMFLALTIYLIGYIVMFATRPSIGVESVTFGNIDAPTLLKGIIVRSEYVEKSNRQGQPTYFYSTGERVKNGSTVCTLRDAQAADVIEEKITKIDQTILDKQKKRSDLSLFQEDIERIENGIKTVLDSYGGKFMQGDLSSLYNLKSQVDTSLNQRNAIWLAENVESTSALSQERERYQSQLSKNLSTYNAKSSGIISFSYDGFEEILNPDTLDNITKEQVNMKISVNQVTKAQSMAKDEPLFKLIDSNQWFIVSFLPVDYVSQWAENDNMTIEITVEDEVKELPVTLKSMQPVDSQVKVVFTVTKGIEAFMDARSIEYKMKKGSFTGIKIPKNAMVEKTLLKIPADCITQSMGESGVLKNVNGQAQFVGLNITRFDEGEAIYYVMQDFNNLKIGDVVLKGEGEEAVNYTITEAESKPGVFVANSAVARFVMVDIVEENNLYAVVRPGGSSYGLQAYDTIVSDAKNIEEGQALY